jgi:hypothetical protein
MAMIPSISELYDSILDDATQSAIRKSEQDFPSFLSDVSLANAGAEQARLALITFPCDDSEQFVRVYAGIFIAAYRLRQKTLVAFPSASHHNHNF